MPAIHARRGNANAENYLCGAAFTKRTQAADDRTKVTCRNCLRTLFSKVGGPPPKPKGLPVYVGHNAIGRLVAPRTLTDALVELDQRGGRAPNPVSIERAGSYLSGNLYLWTRFGERAFVMDRADAEKLIKDFPKELDGATILGRAVSS